MQDDPSHGWDAVADQLVAGRSRAGAAALREWSNSVRPSGCILDVGCGAGVPVTEVLLEAGFDVWGIDASPRLVAEYRRRFPRARVRCEPAESSDLYGRSFDGVVAVGLLFLLSPDRQPELLRKMAGALSQGGQLLFTAPWQQGSWEDMLTRRVSTSLGAPAYRHLLQTSGLTLVAEFEDEGQNHHFHAALR